MDNFLGGLLAILTMVVTAGLGVGVIIAWCKIAQRLGYDSISGLLMLVPVVNICVFFFWAFKESPNERRIRSLKEANSRLSLREVPHA